MNTYVALEYKFGAELTLLSGLCRRARFRAAELDNVFFELDLEAVCSLVSFPSSTRVLEPSAKEAMDIFSTGLLSCSRGPILLRLVFEIFLSL